MKNNDFITIKTTKKAYDLLKSVAFLNNQKQYEVLETLLDKELNAYHKQHIEGERKLYKKLFGNTNPVSRSVEDMLKELCERGELAETDSKKIIESIKL